MPEQRLSLELNNAAPLFILKDIFGRTINLQEYKGKKVFIGFFRHAGCPFCNIRVHTLLKHHEALKNKNMEMIFFFESKETVMQYSAFHKEVSPIPLISDPEKIWYNAYGIEASGIKSTVSHLTGFLQTTIKAKLLGLPVHLMKGEESVTTMPAEFLLDENLVIRKLHYSQGLNDRLSVKEITEFAELPKV